MRVVIGRVLGPIERFAVDRVHCSPDLKKSLLELWRARNQMQMIYRMRATGRSRFDRSITVMPTSNIMEDPRRRLATVESHTEVTAPAVSAMKKLPVPEEAF